MKISSLRLWLGLALLIATLFGFSRGLHAPAVDHASSSGSLPKELPRVAVSFGHVDVRDGVIPVYPLQPGRVVSVAQVSRDGKEVATGTPLFQLDDTLARAQLAEAQADLSAARVQVDQARQQPEQHEQMLQGQQAVVQAKEHELRIAQMKLDDAKRLAKEDIGRKDIVETAEQYVQISQSALEGEKAKLRGLKVLNPKLLLRKATEDVAAKEALVKKAQFALDECTVKAPCKGKVLRLLTGPGETLSPNPRQPALYFCPSTPRIIRAEIEQEFAGRVVLDQEATIQDDTHTGTTWKGKVVQVSDWYTQRRSILLEPLQFNDVRTLECILEVKEEPGSAPLRIGQRVRVIFGGS